MVSHTRPRQDNSLKVGHSNIGLAGFEVADLACTCCGDLRLNPEFWPKFDAFAIGRDIEIIYGYLCWDTARTEYAKSKQPGGRFRLSGTFERLLYGRSFVIAGTVKEHEKAAKLVDLEVVEFNGAVEIRIPVKHKTT